MVNALLYDILDIATECTNRRVRRWLITAAMMLLGGNVSFFWTLGAATSGRWLETAMSIAVTGLLLLGTGISLVSALAAAIRSKRGDLPAMWTWIAFAIVMAMVITPPPLALLAIATLAIVALWRGINHRSHTTAGPSTKPAE